jgi:ribose transport system substrate-binding protein
MDVSTQERDPYLVKAVVHSSRLLKAFRSPGEALSLKEIASRSGLQKTMAFRLLYTLQKCGMVEKVGENLYQSFLRPWKSRLYRLGYAAQGAENQFSRTVSLGLQRSAMAEGIDLISLDNRYSPRMAQRNAELLVREKVDLVIEFQTDETVAPILAAIYREAKIPLIAIDIPHPGATYYGANNYEAGLIAGRFLGKWVKENWNSELDEIILVELGRAGPLPRMRLTGMLFGLHAVLPNSKNAPTVYLDGDGELGPSLEAVRRHLRGSRSRRQVVGAINDPSALGALRAFQEAGRSENCAIVSHNASLEGRVEIRQPHSRLIGSVAFFPERYGEDLIRVSTDILNHRPVPPAVFVEHKLITRSSVDHYYPNDSLLQTIGLNA